MKTSLIKMFRDIKQYLGRTMLTMAGILIGIAAVGAVLSAYSILNREMKQNFMMTNPASIVFKVKNLDNNAVKLIKKAYSNTDIEVRKTVLARLSNSDGTFGTIYLYAIADFHQLKVDTFTLEKGQFPSNDSEMALERDCFKILPNITADNFKTASLHVKLPNGAEKNLQLSGIVHDPGLAPASMEKFSYAFLTMDALRSLGYGGGYDEIRIVCHDRRFDRAQMWKVSQDMKRLLAVNGYQIIQVNVPVPGKHPHADQLDSILFLLQAFTVISLLVACIIIINLLNFMISKQAKQIAIMKTVGASTNAIAFPYFLYVLLISAIALLFSIPLSIAGGASYSDFAAYILNFKIFSYAIPYWVFIVQVLTAIIVPLASAAVPIYKNCAKSVREGMNEKNDRIVNTGQGNFVKTMILGTSSKLIMPINNLLRKKSRTILAMLALAVGGILFMISQNIVASIDKTVTKNMEAFKWDYEISLAGSYPEERLKDVLNRINGLSRSEIWMVDTVFIKQGNGIESAYYKVKILPDDTRMVKFATEQMKQTQNPLMITRVVADEAPWLKPGMRTEIEIGAKKAQMTIAGVATEIPSMPFVYMERSTYEKFFNGAPKQLIVARADTRDAVAQQKIKKTIETEFKSAGFEIAENINIYLLRKAFVEHLHIIVTLLTIIAMLAVIVGGLSIAASIGISVSERKREIGVLRAVGVNSHQIIAMISTEVFLMGIGGWLIGVILSYPVSVWVGNYFGQIFLHVNLDNALSVTGSILWLLISLTVSLLSGIIPAGKVAIAPLREMLGYE